ncbi:MAG TPA: glycosyltransferase [Stellaceae bacterium]|nr:glycosyltransferase [Stellaceae bacterium]
MTGVSFIITVFDKRPYLPRVIDALARQGGPFQREFVFVDDGSRDGSAEVIAECTTGWRDPVIIVRQPNRGAAAATNAGARRASLPWLKLVDGDDLLVPGATAWMLKAAAATGHAFAYGALGTYRFDDPAPLAQSFPEPAAGEEPDGLARFIRNVPANSSAILVSARRYREAGGCDERMVSPDAALFLRLFLAGGGARLDGPVALVPDAAPRRLSEQTRRSRYESVLALYYLVAENPRLDPRYVALAYRRALSRARRFHRAHGGALLSRHLLAYLASLVRVPADPAGAIHRALAAFTEDGSTERPAAWLPGALRQSLSEG